MDYNAFYEESNYTRKCKKRNTKDFLVNNALISKMLMSVYIVMDDVLFTIALLIYNLNLVVNGVMHS